MDGAVGVDLAGLLGQDGLGVVGGHAEQGDDPHPEDGAGPADEDGARGTDDVARAHLAGDGRGQGLEGAHAGLVLAAAQGEAAKDAAPPLGKAAELDEPGADREIETAANQHDDEDVVRQVGVDCRDNIQQLRLHKRKTSSVQSIKTFPEKVSSARWL